MLTPQKGPYRLPEGPLSRAVTFRGSGRESSSTRLWGTRRGPQHSPTEPSTVLGARLPESVFDGLAASLEDADKLYSSSLLAQQVASELGPPAEKLARRVCSHLFRLLSVRSQAGGLPHRPDRDTQQSARGGNAETRRQLTRPHLTSAHPAFTEPPPSLVGLASPDTVSLPRDSWPPRVPGWLLSLMNPCLAENG